MTTATERHHQAMARAEDGDRLRRAGRHDDARAAYEDALQLERRAAELARRQPSRGILLRSAAWLALEAEQPREAERLAACALAAEDIGDRIAEELRAVMEEARIRMTGRLPPPSAESSLGVHLDGPEIGYGTAELTVLLPRVEALKNVLYRGAERRAGASFRRRGVPPAAVREVMRPRVQVVQGSVVARLLLGGGQQELWDRNAELVRDLHACFEAWTAGHEERLRALIPDAAYRANFDALAHRLGPDGDQVHTVGLIASAGGKAFPATLLSRPERVREPLRSEGSAERVIEGELRAADETQATNLIKVVTERGVETVVVSDALMDDIVRPFYGSRVRIRASKRKRKWQMVGLPELADAKAGEIMQTRELAFAVEDKS